MTETGEFVAAVCREHAGDPTRLLDIARAVQARLGCVPPGAMDEIARETGAPRVEVESLVSFYSFLSREPRGRVAIRLADDLIDRFSGCDAVREAFSEELGIPLGGTTADGAISLDRTACIGMSDQAPAALVNDTVVTDLDPERARRVVRELRDHGDPARLVAAPGDGRNAHPLVRAMVKNNIREIGPIVLGPPRRGEAVHRALAMHPAEVIRAVKTARLRGRGGAGFPTGMKWEFTRAAPGERRYLVANADEGEPGTFKDRVLLTEFPDRLFAGMTIAGYAIGAEEGLLYLRAEYAYLSAYLESVLERRRADGLLGDGIGGRHRMSFDIRIQMGAGAYVCGEETALLTSCEGRRGDPRNRPPYPAQQGYRGYPTAVNNVETLCCVTKILQHGPARFSELGTPQSPGTKLLSISGDVERPGVYELPFGVTLREVLEKCGGTGAGAVQVGGASGRTVGPADLDRVFSFEDLSTGGAVAVFSPDRDLAEIALAYLEFFEDESCGYCTPCRAGTGVFRETVERIRAGRGEPDDLVRMEELGATMIAASRCGLGQTAPQPVLSSLAAFRPFWDGLVREEPDGYRRSFDLAAARRPPDGKGARG